MGKLEHNKLIKRNALYNTAFELFTTKGLTKTTISDIVEKAGVAKGTFYLYFKDKYDIRNKLVAHKTGEMFRKADEAMHREGIQGFRTQIHFIVDYIIDLLAADLPLLIFISKNLSWGAFRNMVETAQDGEGFHYYDSYLTALLADTGASYEAPELLLFTILELVSGTCHSCLALKQPVPMDTYRPFLHRSIDGILDAFRTEQEFSQE